MRQPTRQPPKTHLTREQLRDMWLVDLAKVDPALSQRYKDNNVLFPMSRYDLIEHYTREDSKTFQWQTENDDDRHHT